MKAVVTGFFLVATFFGGAPGNRNSSSDTPQVGESAAPTHAAVLPAVKILPDPDPAILRLVAREKKDGTIRIRSMQDFPEGTISRISSYHDNDVEMLDDSGNVLSSRPIGLAFYAILDPKPGRTLASDRFGLDEASIQLKLAYPPQTALVRFRKGDKVLFEIDPVSQTLRTAVEKLPDGAFTKEPSQRRKALLAKVDAFEKQLSKKAFTGALENLRNDLRARALDWLVELPAPAVGSQTSKSDLLALIDRIDARVQARAATR